MSNMLTGSAWSTANYDLAIIAWSSLPTLQPNVTWSTLPCRNEDTATLTNSPNVQLDHYRWRDLPVDYIIKLTKNNVTQKRNLL